MGKTENWLWWSASAIRNLSDKLYEKRKVGALEIEQQVKDLKGEGDASKIYQIITYIVQNFSNSVNPNYRKGGASFLCLAGPCFL